MSAPPARRGSSFADDWKWSDTTSSTTRGAGRSFRSPHSVQADAGDANPAGEAAKAAPRDAHAATAGRDCRDTSCNRTLRLVSIRDITLDVTPRLAPGAEADEAEAEARAQRLQQAPSRQWRSPEGHLVVEGRLVDLRRGEALVESSEGRIVNLPIHRLGEDERCFVAAWWKLPNECSLGEEGPMAPRMWTPSTFTWTASGLCHKPLYFQETQLERYGHSAHPLIQPVLSGAHFFASMATLPYQAGIHPPYECQYDLGYYRVGDCAPWLLPPVPISLRGGLLQAGVLTGGVFLFP